MFALSEEIVSRLAFAMEDKTSDSLVDLATGEVLPASAEGSTEPGGVPAGERRLVPPPAWGSRDGFLLMERFAQGLRAGAPREALLSALKAPSGVFKAFREALRPWPDLEGRWRSFHDRELAALIRAWHRSLALESGLEALGPEAEADTGPEAALADFSVRSIGLAQAEAALRVAFTEPPLLYASLSAEERDLAEAQLLSLAREAETSGEGLFLEASPPAAEEPSSPTLLSQTGTATTFPACLLISRVFKMGEKRGLSISCCLVSPDLADCGLEELLCEEALSRCGASTFLRWEASRRLESTPGA